MEIIQRTKIRAHPQEMEDVGEFSDLWVNRSVFILSFSIKTPKDAGFVPMHN